MKTKYVRGGKIFLFILFFVSALVVRKSIIVTEERFLNTPGAKFEQDLQELIVSQGIESTVASYAIVQVENRVALYAQTTGNIELDDENKKQNVTDFLNKYVGNLYIDSDKWTAKEGIQLDWYSIDGLSNIKYLIAKDKDGQYSLWEYKNFLMYGSSEEDNIILQSKYSMYNLSPITYGEVLKLIYNVDEYKDIQRMDIEEVHSAHIFEDMFREEIQHIEYSSSIILFRYYDILNDIHCYSGISKYSYADRFLYTDSHLDMEIEYMYRSRMVTLYLRDGTKIGDWCYDAIKGCFYNRNYMITEQLEEKEISSLNMIFGISD